MVRIVSKPSYAFEEFLRHFDDLHRLEEFRRNSFEYNVGVTMDYMHCLYEDQRECIYKAGRFVLIMNYLSEHITDFDISDYAVHGSDEVGSLANEHLLRAVHEFFTTYPQREEPSPSDIMLLADKYRNPSEP